jgi:hypothetical protein
VAVSASGHEVPGWTVEGSIQSSSSQPVSLFLSIQGEGDQTLSVTPTDLSTVSIEVDPSSFGGKDRVSEAEFVQVSEKWCTSRR